MIQRLLTGTSAATAMRADERVLPSDCDTVMTVTRDSYQDGCEVRPRGPVSPLS